MGAHNQATLNIARDRAEAVVAMLKTYPGYDQVAQYWVDEIEHILETGRTEGTLKAWMKRHDGDPIDTLQTAIVIARDGHGVIDPARPWSPGSRRVDATRAACVLLNGSRRDYAGVTTFLVTERGYIGFASFGESAVQMLVYVR